MHVPTAAQGAQDWPANRPHRPGSRLWLVAGTGEGPPLAEALLARGWRLRLSVVTAAATRAYPPHPHLQVGVGALGAASGDSPHAAVERELAQAEAMGDPFGWVVDASHPFARRISAALAGACAARRQPLLRLQRPLLPLGRALLLEDLEDLPPHHRPGEHLLLALGARRLAEAIAASPGARHHARVLPSVAGLQQALAAGLEPGRLACLRPGRGAAAIEAALCRRWQIDTVLCRQSGGSSEAGWHRHCEALHLRLLLLRRPPEPPGVEALEGEALLARIGAAPLP